jgi:hypothetical protein
MTNSEIISKLNEKSFIRNTLCIYAYYEKSEEYIDNFKYFLQNGLDTDMDYIIVINGNCSVDIKSYVKENTELTILQRENKGYDFGAYYHALVNKDVLNNPYKNYIFLNTSVKGPYLNNKHFDYINKTIYNNTNWYKIFTDMIKEDVKLVGTTINICTLKFNKLNEFKPPYTHVQTQFFGMDHECLSFLYDKIFAYKVDESNFYDLIELKEVRMTLLVLQNNWNINCPLSHYKDLDYRQIKNNFNPTSANGDSSFRNAYFGRTYNKYEVVFIKTAKWRGLYIEDDDSI